MENNQESKQQIFRVYYSFGKPNAKGKYQTDYVKVTAADHKEAREKAKQMGVNERRKVVKWFNVLNLDKDQK